MLTVVFIAAAIAVGAHPIVVGLAVLATTEPRLMIAAAAVWGVRSYRQRPRHSAAEAEAAFLRALAAELRAGASLRHALADTATRASLGLEHVARLAAAGAAMGSVAPIVRDRLLHNGVTVAAALELSSRSGARTAAVFEGLADRATEAAELHRERRAATTQARLSAGVVGLAPLVFTALLLSAGGMRSLTAAGSAGVAIVLVGLALEVAGLAAVALVLRRESR